MNSNKTLSIIEQSDINNILYGALMIVVSVLTLLNGILSTIFLGISVILLFYKTFYMKKLKKESNDELSIKNENISAMYTLRNTMILLCCFAGIAICFHFFKDISFSLAEISHFVYSFCIFIIGFSSINFGLYFRAFEKDDDSCTF